MKKLSKTKIRHYGTYKTVILGHKSKPGDGVQARGVKGG